MKNLDADDEKRRQQKNFREGYDDHTDNRQQIMGVKNGDNIKRERTAGPRQPKDGA
jgi:hypothetical protein